MNPIVMNPNTNDSNVKNSVQKFHFLRLLFLETSQNRINAFESFVNFFADLGSGQDDFAGDENEQHHPRSDHSVDQSGKEFWFITAKLRMLQDQSFQSDIEFDIATSHHVLNFEIRELGVKAQLLDDTGVLPRGQLGFALAFGAGTHHFARAENQGGRSRLTDPHNDGRKPFGIVLCVARFHCNLFEIQFATQIYSRDNVPVGKKD
jgi:hypothetical protein